MSKPTFYVDKNSIKGKIATIRNSRCKQIRKVLRMGRGDQLDLTDGCGRRYKGEIKEISSREVKVFIENSTFEKPSISQINLILGIPKIVKVDEIISRGTELGINTFLLCNAERSIKLKQFPINKLERWKNLSAEAIELSGRTYLPQIEFYYSVKEAIAPLKSVKANKLIAHVGAKDHLSFPFCNPLLPTNANSPQITYIAIGPEGGWTDREISLATSCGFNVVNLGKHTLSTQTAVFYSASIIDFLLNYSN